MFEGFLLFMAPYWTSVGVYILAHFTLGFFEELIGIRGIVKILAAFTIAVLFYYYWDSAVMKFVEWLNFMGLEIVKPEK